MAVKVSFTTQDAYSRFGKKEFEGVDTVLADAKTSAAALLSDFGAVSDLGVVRETYTDEVLVFGAAQAAANLDTGGTIRVRLNDGSVGIIKIPGIKASLVNVDGTIKVDDEDILAYVANFESSGKYRISDGQYVVGIISGKLDR